ncbi:MAG: DUF2784 domain-containing protein, partial [Steroidobacteraceae bacterium]
LFIVGGLVAIVIGNLTGHKRVNVRWFRFTHLGAIAFVVLQTWLGQICPLTTLESWLRVQADQPAYRKSFIEDWLHRVLFYEARPWVFTLVYSVFGAVVLVSWFAFPPARRGSKGAG